VDLSLSRYFMNEKKNTDKILYFICNKEKVKTLFKQEQETRLLSMKWFFECCNSTCGTHRICTYILRSIKLVVSVVS
jgi:hypothetical protein